MFDPSTQYDLLRKTSSIHPTPPKAEGAYENNEEEYDLINQIMRSLRETVADISVSAFRGT
jgi:hypothetical protein